MVLAAKLGNVVEIGRVVLFGEDVFVPKHSDAAAGAQHGGPCHSRDGGFHQPP